VVDAARDPAGGLPFAVFEVRTGPATALASIAILVLAIVAAMVSFHHGVARYVFALARERVLPGRLARVGLGKAKRGGAPVGGSLVQSAAALGVIMVVAATGADPLGVLFTWLSTLAAIGVLALLTMCSWAGLRFYANGGGTNESWVFRTLAPALGIITGSTMLGTLVLNVSALLGVPPGDPLTLLLPSVIGVAFLAGSTWSLRIRRSKSEVWAGIGRGIPEPLAVPDQRLADLTV
jgi:amino acid transporter